MLPVIRGKDLVAFLEKRGFVIIRQKESHVRMTSDDGRYTTIPVQTGEDIPKGLLRKIIRDDLEMTLEEFSTHMENIRATSQSISSSQVSSRMELTVGTVGLRCLL